LEPCRDEPGPPSVPDDTPRLMIDLVHVPGRSRSRAQSAEATALAERFAELRELGVDPGGMVVLVRKYAHAAPVAAALRAAGFSVLVTGGRRFLGRPEIRMARALCRVIANPLDEQALVELLLSPMSAVSDDGVWLLRNAEGGADRGRGIWDALGDSGLPLDAADAAAARLLRDVVAHARERAGSTGLGEVILSAVEESGADRVLLCGGDDGLQAFANVVRFARKADECERSGVAVGAAAFCVRIDAEERYGDQETPSAVSADGSSAVRVMSVHAAKGLEFPVVGLVMLGESASPAQGVLETDVRDGRLELALALPPEWGGKAESRRTRRFDELRAGHGVAEADEAKRLLYVACTRAREVLVMCGSGDLDAEPAPGGRSGLDLMRLALAHLFEGGTPGTDATRALEDETRVSVRVHEVDDGGGAGEQDAADAAATARGGTCRPVRAETYEPPREVRESLEGPRHPAPLRPERLSYSDIASFETCPLRYWAQSVARLGDISPVDDGSPARFGSALHALLQTHAVSDAHDVEERSAALARYHRLGREGAARLRDAVIRLRDSRLEGELAAHEVVRREHPFSVRISSGEHGFALAGFLDAYGRTAEDALVVDYKSGTAAEPPAALRARYARQAECYAYAVLREGCCRVRVVFARPEVPSADGEPELVEFVYGTQDAARIERSLAAVYESIATERYAPRAVRDDHACRGCRVAGSLCPLTNRRGAG
ncbi:MAG TPA: PD-(D/E)XK nuclease family protein, partial [Coriobacteriia bacterium]|nr:PD-(D/E)XK nuclease family protein [Coriobacteriia bacterium]